MLELTRKDLSRSSVPGGSPGVRVWQIPVPRRKTPSLVVAWTDLVLISPKLTWPTGFNPELVDGWGEFSFRFTWVERMQRTVAFPDVPVPDLTPFRRLRRGDLPRIRPARSPQTTKARGLVVFPFTRDDGGIVYASTLATRRVTAAVEHLRGEIDLREATLPGRHVVLAYRDGRLRAIVDAFDREALLA